MRSGHRLAKTPLAGTTPFPWNWACVAILFVTCRPTLLGMQQTDSRIMFSVFSHGPCPGICAAFLQLDLFPRLPLTREYLALRGTYMSGLVCPSYTFARSLRCHRIYQTPKWEDKPLKSSRHSWQLSVGHLPSIYGRRFRMVNKKPLCRERDLISECRRSLGSSPSLARHNGLYARAYYNKYTKDIKSFCVYIVFHPISIFTIDSSVDSRGSGHEIHLSTFPLLRWYVTRGLRKWYSIPQRGQCVVLSKCIFYSLRKPLIFFK